MCLDFGGKKNDFLIHFGVFYSVWGQLKYALYTEYKESTKLIFFLLFLNWVDDANGCVSDSVSFLFGN